MVMLRKENGHSVDDETDTKNGMVTAMAMEMVMETAAMETVAMVP